MMVDNKDKISLVIIRVLLLVFIVVACSNAKDSKPFKLPTIHVATKSNVATKSDVSATETVETVSIKEPKIVSVATRSKLDRLIFVGDVYFSNKVRNAYDKKGISGIVDESYRTLLRDGDLTIGNFECAITDGDEEKVEKEYNLFTPEKYIKAIKDLGFDVLTLANNHVIDFGKDVFLDTMEILKKNNISYVGAGKNINEAKKYYLKEIEGKKYAIFAASAVIPTESWKASEKEAGVNNGYDIAEVCKDIRKIRKNVDKVIVYMHWGDELATHSNEGQRALAHKLIDFGADLVVGSHPHVVQEIEYYKDVPIVYSLGNFIYGSTKRETMLLEATFDYSVSPEGFLLLRIYPGLSNYEQVKEYWQEEEFAKMCKAIQDNCTTCYVADNGYIFTVEAVNKALGLATESEIKEEESK